jgi:hypothetical protein
LAACAGTAAYGTPSSVAELADFTSYSFRAAGQNATLVDELRTSIATSTYRHHDLRARADRRLDHQTVIVAESRAQAMIDIDQPDMGGVP